MATIKWISGNGSWTTASNWSPGTVPGSSDDAVIDASGTYTVTLDRHDHRPLHRDQRFQRELVGQ